jgi:hypothetical protein
MSLMQEMGNRALKLGIPLSVQMDVTYRCSERCVHCYLDHDDPGEMTTAEIKGILDQLAEAGVFFQIFSGGEVFMRMDFFELVEYARSLMCSVRVKTNAFMVGEEEADRPGSRAHRCRAGQHLLASAGSTRCDHSGPPVARKIGCRNPPVAGTWREGNPGQCSDARELPGLRRRQGAGAGTGRGVHYRSHHHAHDGRRPVHTLVGDRAGRAAAGLPR